MLGFASEIGADILTTFVSKEPALPLPSSRSKQEISPQIHSPMLVLLPSPPSSLRTDPYCFDLSPLVASLPQISNPIELIPSFRERLTLTDYKKTHSEDSTLCSG